MGAEFQTMTLAGDKTRNEVKEAFAAAQDQDRYENGHSYSGGFGMASGLKFSDATLANPQAAKTWLNDNCQKWEEAICVTYTDDAGAARWMIGAWCAS